MAKYDIIYSCGHEGRVDIIGPTKDRQRKADWYASGLCPECYEAKKLADRAAELEKAKANAVEMELPELTGTEKQVAWAMKIRDAFVSSIADREEPEHDFAKRLLNVVIDGNLAQTTAKWWIDWRENDHIMNPARRLHEVGEDIARLLKINIFKEEEMDKLISAVTAMTDAELYGAVLGQKPADVAEREYMADTEAERTIRPESPKTEAILEISETVAPDGTTVRVVTPERDENFNPTVRHMGYKWVDGAWQQKYAVGFELLDDRIIHIAVTALSLDYVVSVPRPELVERVKNRDYKSFNTKVVKHHIKTNKFAIRWTREDGDFYNSAKRIGKAVWDKDAGAVLVAPEMFAEVLDFAERFGFEVSSGALGLVEQAKASKEAALVVDVKPVKKAKAKPLGDKPEKLAPVEADIAPELRDS
ncbi:hypothetical protein FACS1894187_10840 [Synergistales bacterium]|nr:hypothetical protein FACS1894187_10840 [Synergistales bacterium]